MRNFADAPVGSFLKHWYGADFDFNKFGGRAKVDEYQSLGLRFWSHQQSSMYMIGVVGKNSILLEIHW